MEVRCRWTECSTGCIVRRDMWKRGWGAGHLLLIFCNGDTRHLVCILARLLLLSLFPPTLRMKSGG